MIHLAPFLAALVGSLGLVWAKEEAPDVLPEEQFFRYVSRPDLLAPRWDITTFVADRVSPGYWLTAPYELLGAWSADKHYIGAQIFSQDGELVWSSADRFNGSNVFGFGTAEVGGTAHLSFIVGSSAVLLDDQYRIVKQFPIGTYNTFVDNIVTNIHVFNLVDNGTRAFVLYNNQTRLSAEESYALGYDKGKCKVRSHTIEEWDTTDMNDWKRVWEWADSADGHISPGESSYLNRAIVEQCESQAGWDFAHPNSVDRCPDGDLLMSARHTDTIYKISRDDGRIVWRLGGYDSDFTLPTTFSRQHHARCHEANDTHVTLTLVDNALGDDNRPTFSYSRGLKLALDLRDMTATVVADYPHPHRRFSISRGTCQVLPPPPSSPAEPGNVFMGWAYASLLSEHSADGSQTLMYAELQPNWLGSYRTFKAAWVGRPAAPPDAVLRVDPDAPVSTHLYVSWNGATEVAHWRLQELGDGGERTIVGVFPKRGFETVIAYESAMADLLIEALDVDGSVLEHGAVEVHAPPEIQARVRFDRNHTWLARVRLGIVVGPWDLMAVGFFTCLGMIVVLLMLLPRKWLKPGHVYTALEMG